MSIYTTVQVGTNGKRLQGTPERRYAAPDAVTAAELAASVALTRDEQRTASVSYNEDGVWTFKPSTGSPVHIIVTEFDDSPRPCEKCGVHDAPSLHTCVPEAAAIERATVQFWSVTGAPAARRATAYAQRVTSPTATHVRDNMTGREGVQVDMFGAYLVIQFADHRTELRAVDAVTLVEQPGARY